MNQKQVSHDVEVLLAALGVGLRRIVGDEACAGTARAQVLPPEQELDGVEADGDILFAALLVAAFYRVFVHPA